MKPELQDPALDLDAVAERALALLRGQGFDAAQVEVGETWLSELNLAHNEPSLLRSTHGRRIALSGLRDGRRAATELTDPAPERLAEAAAALWQAAASAPRDEAHAVSAGQRAAIVQGPVEVEPAQLGRELADAMAGLLAFRAEQTPTLMIEEALAAHTRQRRLLCTSAGSRLASDLGWYGLMVMGLAREDGRSSSFDYTGGEVERLDGAPVHERCGIGTMMRALTRQVRTEPWGPRGPGEVVLTPAALADLLDWLLGQLGDTALIAGTSLYRDRVGQVIASPLLDLASRFDAPGVAAVSADGFATPPVQLLREGRLQCLTPSFYGSRRTGLPHVPLAAGGGWALAAGATPLAELLAGVGRGALVGRLSMGNPAPDGSFSGVIKNSFALRDGVLGPALAETMIAGNIANLLRDVVALSAERVDRGAWCLPWLRAGGLNFS